MKGLLTVLSLVFAGLTNGLALGEEPTDNQNYSSDDLQVTDSFFVVGTADESQQISVTRTNFVPLIPDRVCYQWHIRIAGYDSLIRYKEVFELPAKPETWGEADENSSNTTYLAEHRRTAITEEYATLKDGWFNHGWCVADGDPAGSYLIAVYVNDIHLKTFEFEDVPVQ